MTTTSTSFKVRGVRPEDLERFVNDLERLDADQFRTVVNADLRRRIAPEAIRPEISQALRTPAIAPLWRSVLQSLLLSVDRQLTARASDHEADALVLATNSRDQDALTGLQAEYLRWRARTERFRSGIEEHLVVAEALCEPDDREHLRRRVATLEDAIRRHRSAVFDDLYDDEVPDPFEVELWRALEDE